MTELTLATPEQLTQVVNSLVLTATEKFDLNRRMANRARQFFRQQIRRQRDIENSLYQPRTTRNGRSKVQFEHKRWKDSDFGGGGGYSLFTTNNRNMLLGFSKGLRTSVAEDSFEVGLKGVAARIGREHNEGSKVSFTTRVNGFYNSNTGRWEGGTRVKNNYQMPQRTFIGWTPALERELMAMAAEHFIQQEAA